MTVHTLDLHFQDTPGLIAAYVIESEGELALIETGPSSTLETLRASIRKLGLHETKIRDVFVTHIHLDHAGAAGWWAQQGAQVYCHPKAAQHLINPSRLMDSARQVYAERMEVLWGEMLPAPPEQVTALQEGESVKIGATTIKAWDTPGHARHHHAFVIGDLCFTGDVAGMRLAGTNYLSVTAAPPQFEPELYLASVDRLAAADFQKLYLTHFGEVSSVAVHLATYRQRIQAVHEAVIRDHQAGLSNDDIRTAYHNREYALARGLGISEEDWQNLERSNATAMCADGVLLNVRRSSS